MTEDEIAEAKAIVLRCPRRPRHTGDEEIVVRAGDLGQRERDLVARLATEINATVRPAGYSQIRESEPTLLIGDTEFEFRISTLV